MRLAIGCLVLLGVAMNAAATSAPTPSSTAPCPANAGESYAACMRRISLEDEDRASASRHWNFLQACIVIAIALGVLALCIKTSWNVWRARQFTETRGTGGAGSANASNSSGFMIKRHTRPNMPPAHQDPATTVLTVPAMPPTSFSGSTSSSGSDAFGYSMGGGPASSAGTAAYTSVSNAASAAAAASESTLTSSNGVSMSSSTPAAAIAASVDMGMHVVDLGTPR